MYQSRTFLDTVYSFKNNFLDQQYIDNSAIIIKKQLVTAGLRLASILKTCLSTPATNDPAYNYFDFKNYLGMYEMMMRVLMS